MFRRRLLLFRGSTSVRLIEPRISFNPMESIWTTQQETHILHFTWTLIRMSVCLSGGERKMHRTISAPSNYEKMTKKNASWRSRCSQVESRHLKVLVVQVQPFATIIIIARVATIGVILQRGSRRCTPHRKWAGSIWLDWWATVTSWWFPVATRSFFISVE